MLPQVTETRARGDLVDPVSFFFQLRHVNAACVGRTRATVFVLSHTDYKQLAASYTDDDAAVLAALANHVASSGSKERTGLHKQDVSSMAHVKVQFMQRVEEAMQRRAEQHVVKLLHAAAACNTEVVARMISTGSVTVRSYLGTLDLFEDHADLSSSFRVTAKNSNCCHMS